MIFPKLIVLTLAAGLSSLASVTTAEAALISGKLDYEGELGPINGNRPLCLCVFTDAALTNRVGCLIRFSNPATYSFNADQTYYMVAFVDIHINEVLEPDEPFEIYNNLGAPPADPVAPGTDAVDFVFGDENLPGNSAPTATETLLPTDTPTPTATATSTSPPPCLGDCDGEGDVTVDEIIELVNIALGVDAISDCRSGDGDGNGAIEVDEIIAVVTNALTGCGSGSLGRQTH